jgi:hypothetical protein
MWKSPKVWPVRSSAVGEPLFGVVTPVADEDGVEEEEDDSLMRTRVP